MRRGHPFFDSRSLDSYCDQPHAVMSISGDRRGFIDEALAALGRSRRVALTLPSFLSILAALEGTDLVAAAPRSMVERFADRFGLAWVEPPLDLETSTICAIATQSAMSDNGVAWLMGLLRRLHSGGLPTAFPGPN
jgi:DNA-binding transcriptional LysR family regulator